MGDNRWQPMETAPKDKEIFGWLESIGLKRKITGQRETIYWRADEKDEVTFPGGRWMIRTSSFSDDYPAENLGSRLTHWMPLPDAPEPPK